MPTSQAFQAQSKKSGVTYYLHSRQAANGKTALYFFAKEIKEGALSALPEGYAISENPLTGLPILKKKIVD